MNFRVIGLAVAFSPTARAMLTEATRLVHHFKAHLVLIHVGPHGSEEEQEMNALVEGSGLPASRYKILWKKGDPVKQILATCRQEKVELLIAGALKKENLVNYYLGTVARKIMRKANCSILLIAHPSLEEKLIKNIVVNAEDSPYVQNAIETACHWPQTEPGTWIHIVRELKLLGLALAANEQCTEEEYARIKQNLMREETIEVEKLMHRVPHGKRKINVKLLTGKSGFELARFAERKRADLLVLGAPRRKLSLLDRVFPHDQEYIFNDLPCNLLVIHPVIHD